MMDAMKAAVAMTVKKKRMSQIGKGKTAMPVTPRSMGAMMGGVGAAAKSGGPMSMGAAAAAKQDGPAANIRRAVLGKAARLARR